MFYNGTDKQPERKVYRLSDAFSKKQDEPELELIVPVLNINAGNNAEILGNCKTPVTECIKEDILAEFLKKNRAEAIEVSIFEYNEELHLANLRREGYEEGIIHGKQQCILEFLEEMSTVSEEVCEIIESQNDIEILSEWLKISARVRSIEEFINMIKAKSD